MGPSAPFRRMVAAVPRIARLLGNVALMEKNASILPLDVGNPKPVSLKAGAVMAVVIVVLLKKAAPIPQPVKSLENVEWRKSLSLEIPWWVSGGIVTGCAVLPHPKDALSPSAASRREFVHFIHLLSSSVKTAS